MSLAQVTEIIAPWNEQLIHLSAEIHRARINYVEHLQAELKPRFFEREEVAIRYVSSLEGKGDLSDYEALITSRLELRLQAEINSGYSLIGPTETISKYSSTGAICVPSEAPATA
jgi:recombinational DNA repair ATPase RecF